MAVYAAFLRAINVGGNNLISMDTLKKLLSSIGCKNIKTYLQSGNAVFESNEKSQEKIKSAIEAKLDAVMKNKIIVFVISIDELKKIAKENAFSKIKGDAKFYATFTDGKQKIFASSEKYNVNFILQKENAALSYAMQKNGRYGDPNGFLEKELKIKATTRNWNTIERILSDF